MEIFGSLNEEEKVNLPTPEQVFAEGGPCNYYHVRYPSVFQYFDSYEVLVDELQHR